MLKLNSASFSLDMLSSLIVDPDLPELKRSWELIGLNSHLVDEELMCLNHLPVCLFDHIQSDPSMSSLVSNFMNVLDSQSNCEPENPVELFFKRCTVKRFKLNRKIGSKFLDLTFCKFLKESCFPQSESFDIELCVLHLLMINIFKTIAFKAYFQSCL